MLNVNIGEIYKAVDKFSGKSITVGGWIRSVRSSKNVGFIDLNDGTSFKGVQIVFTSQDSPNFLEVSKLNAGSSIKCKGKLLLTPKNKQPFEIHAENIQVLSKTDELYPLQKKGHSLEFLRKEAYLRPRTNLFNAVFRIRSESAFALHTFFHSRGFIYLNAPILSSSDCEGAGELFKISTQDIYGDKKIYAKDELFGKKVFLSPSCQLEAEAFALSMSKVYTFGPSFRAENSNTLKHINEFWHVEPEMAFYDLFDNMDFMEDMIKYVIDYLLKNCKDELEFLNNFIEKGLISKLKKVLNVKFERVTYDKAIEELKKYNEKFKFKVKWGIDLQTEHEKCLTQEIYGKPVFVYNYPKEIKAFYMRVNDDNKTVGATDLLFPQVGELCGASQREERYNVLLKSIKEKGLNEKDYTWYLNLRKFGSVKHSGFGMGFDRLIMYVTGMQNIRDVIPFPRTPKNCKY